MKPALVLSCLCLFSMLSGPPECEAGETQTARFPLADYEAAALPTNGDGDTYPCQYAPAGAATVALDSDAAEGKQSVALTLTAGKAYPHFNPFNTAGKRSGVTSGKGFAREYGCGGGKWTFNTYNRLAFWMKNPASEVPLAAGGRQNIEFGTYVKKIAEMDAGSDETGGNHYYHFLNIAPTGTWTRVILNMHPNHQRGGPGGHEWGNMEHPTGEKEYNYFDTFTRFYFEYLAAPSGYPAVYRYDGFEFYREQYEENDEQVYSIACTCVPGENRVILTWFRNKKEDAVKHEIRYAFENIHVIGWDKATAAPDGVITPPGVGGYGGMVYDTRALPLEPGAVLYLAIKPENSELFSQISIPLPGGVE